MPSSRQTEVDTSASLRHMLMSCVCGCVCVCVQALEDIPDLVGAVAFLHGDGEENHPKNTCMPLIGVWPTRASLGCGRWRHRVATDVQGCALSSNLQTQQTAPHAPTAAHTHSRPLAHFHIACMSQAARPCHRRSRRSLARSSPTSGRPSSRRPYSTGQRCPRAPSACSVRVVQLLCVC
jgi:hypothetical protein